MFKSLRDNQILRAETVTQMSLSEKIPEEQGLDLNLAASLVVWLAFSALPVSGSLWAKCPCLSLDLAARGSVLVLHPDKQKFRQIKPSLNKWLKEYSVGALPHDHSLKSYFSCTVKVNNAWVVKKQLRGFQQHKSTRPPFLPILSAQPIIPSISHTFQYWQM